MLKPSPSVFQLVTKLDFPAPIPPAQDTKETALALMPLPAHWHWLPESAFPARIAKAASSGATKRATLTFRYSLPCSQPNEHANGSLDILFCFCLFRLYPPLRLSFLISSRTKPVSRPLSPWEGSSPSFEFPAGSPSRLLTLSTFYVFVGCYYIPNQTVNSLRAKSMS